MFFLPFSYVEYQEGDEFLSLDDMSPGDLPIFRISELNDSQIQFRLQSGADEFIIEHSTDMKLWQRATVTDTTTEDADWNRLTVPRGDASAGFYRAVIYSNPQ